MDDRITDELIEELGVIRESGLANMLSVTDVLNVAVDLDLYVAEAFCHDVLNGDEDSSGVWFDAMMRLGEQ